jgi:TonB family protein
MVLHREKKASETSKDTIIVRQNFQVIDTVSFLIEPRKISKDNPIYPAEAIEKNINGSVKIKLKINKEGTVSKSLIENSSGYSILDSATTAYTKSLKFSPALENGRPKDIWIYMTFKYVIDE